MVLSILKKLKRWKSLISFMSRPKHQKKIIILKCCLLLLYTTANQFLTRMWQYDNWWWPAQWLDWEEAPTCVLVAQSCLTLCDPLDCSLQGSSVHGIFQMKIVEWVAISFSRGSSRLRDQTQVSCIVGRLFTTWASREASLIHTKLAPKNRYCRSLVVCCPSDPLYPGIQLSESQWDHYIWDVCSANCWDTLKTVMPAAIGQWNGPNSPQHLTAHHTNSASNIEWIGLCFVSSAIFTWPLANRLPRLQASQHLFCRKTLPQPAGGRTCFPRVHQILKHRFLCYKNKQSYFLLAKMCWF